MKPTQPLLKALRRLPLTTKQGPHNYYKGNQTGSMGRHTKHGRYMISYDKVRTYVCPDLTDFPLTPFVSKRIETRQDTFKNTATNSPLDGKEYLRKWKDVIGHYEHGENRVAATGGAVPAAPAYEADMQALLEGEKKEGGAGEGKTKG